MTNSNIVGKLKLLVLGLDGGTFDIITPLINNGKLPTLKKIIEKGNHAELESTIPPQTAPAWTSFMTGRNPGKHGIYGFIEYDPSSYSGFFNEKFVSSRCFAGSTFFDILKRHAYKTGVITVPMTYPPWDINGIMISGYPCPDTDRIYSFSANTNLNFNNRLNFSSDYYEYTSPEDIYINGLEMMETRTNLAIDIVHQNDLDCLILVLGETDRAQHDFWKYKDTTHKFHDAIDKHYEVADQQLEKLLQLTDKNTRIFIISDHGGGPHPSNYFNINSWLSKEEFINLNDTKAKYVDVLQYIYLKIVIPVKKRNKFISKIIEKKIINKNNLNNIYISNFNWTKTKAFYYPMEYPAFGIVINVKERQPQGVIEQGSEYENLRDEIIEKLSSLKSPETNQNIIKKIYKKEELYSGRFLKNAPDIISILSDNYFIGKEFTNEIVKEIHAEILKNSRALHRMNGIFIANGPNIKKSVIKDAKIIDAAPTILHSLGIEIPRDTDGKVLDIFSADYLKNNPIKYQTKNLSDFELEKIRHLKLALKR